MSNETLQVIAQHTNLCKFIHLPVQSGSNRILKLMNRKYTREWYLDRIAAIRRILPDAAISTDVFCGFHSETIEEHQETLSLMREVGFAVHEFKNTVGSTLYRQVYEFAQISMLGDDLERLVGHVFGVRCRKSNTHIRHQLSDGAEEFWEADSMLIACVIYTSISVGVDVLSQ